MAPSLGKAPEGEAEVSEGVEGSASMGKKIASFREGAGAAVAGEEAEHFHGRD
jgi:hypothetical protein